METLITSAGLLIAFIVLFASMYILLIMPIKYIRRKKERKFIQKIKNKVLEKPWMISHRKGTGGHACWTFTEIDFTNGEYIKISLDPVSSPFGVYEIQHSFNKDLNLDMDYVGKKLHDWAMTYTY